MGAENDAVCNQEPDDFPFPPERNDGKMSRAEWLLRDREGWSREPMLGRDGWWYRKVVKGVCLCRPQRDITGMAAFSEAMLPDYPEGDWRWEDWALIIEKQTEVRIAYAIAEEPECNVCGYERQVSDPMIQIQVDQLAAQWRAMERRRCMI